MEKTAQKNIPPDKRNFANILKKQGEPSFLKKNHGDLPKVKSRWFTCRIRNKGLKYWIIDQFKHLAVCGYQFMKCDKRKHLVLNVGFDISTAEGQAEYKRAESITLPSGSVLKAVPDERLQDGQYQPTPIQKIYLECVPLELFSDKAQLISALDEYVDFFGVDMWEWVCERGCFTGKVSVEVKLIKKPLPRDFELAFRGVTVRLLTITRGLSTKIKTETDDLASIVCHSCKKTGHLSKNCQVRKNRIFSWKCTVCKGHSFNTGCTEGKCKVVNLKKKADLVMMETPFIKERESQQNQSWNQSSREEFCKYSYTKSKICRRADGLSKMKLPKAKGDEVYMKNLPKLYEMKAIKLAVKSCSQGFDGFVVAFEKKLLEYANGGHLQYAEWYSIKLGTMWSNADKFETDTLPAD